MKDERSALLHLVASGALSLEFAHFLLERLCQGNSVLVIGPNSSGQKKLVHALADEVARFGQTQALTKLAVSEMRKDLGFYICEDANCEELLQLMTQTPQGCFVASLRVAGFEAFLREIARIWKSGPILESICISGYNKDGQTQFFSASTMPGAGQEPLKSKTLNALPWSKENTVCDPGWELESEGFLLGGS